LNLFNNEEQQLFFSSFYTYLNYDKERDFVIELNKVWKWLGFSRIDPCKRVLEKYFIKDSDYKIVFHQPVENLNETDNLGGRPKETILLNVKTFKKLCLKSNTKRADSIHDYFIRLEEVLQEILLEESQDLQRELTTLKRLKAKKWHDQEPGDTIYAIKVEDMIKLGKTRNIKKRESYYTENQTGDMFYIKRCYNCDLAEKVIHHILDKHREENNKDTFRSDDTYGRVWFNISNELAIYM